MFNPFATVSSYSEMLNKIAFYTWGGATLVTLILRKIVPEIDSALAPYSVQVSFLGFALPFGTIAPAFLLALISRIFKLHDRISDLLGIRVRFDVSEILLPLALQSRASVRVDAIRRSRRNLMNTAFYAFASSSPGAAAIPAHYVTLALDQWSWYWVIVESTVTLTVSAAVCAAFKHFGASSAFLGLVLLLLWALQGVRIRCRNLALDEVEQILSDDSRTRTVMEAFNALSRQGS
jgi:hypothetical protein